MSDFSVISSIISPGDIGCFVSNEYPLPKDLSCRLLKTGINHTYQIDSNKERYIFRVYSYNWRTKDEIDEELKLLHLLRQNKISVSFPIADSEEKYIQTMNTPEGVRFAVLFSFAQGHKIYNYSEAIHFEIGKLMAQMHSLTKDLQQARITYTSDVLLNKSVDYIKEFLSGDTEEMKFLLKTKSTLETEILNADVNAIRSGIVHLDIWFDNLNISNDGKITLFDFDFCGNGWLCTDIAYYILQLHNTEKNELERNEKMNAFYRGYESIQKISSEEKRLIPVLGVCLHYFYLGIQCKRFDNWSNTFLNDVYLKRYITVLIKSYYKTTN
jgi:Ser/Thr protein kinase RdoA (MazF antagonist)